MRKTSSVIGTVKLSGTTPELASMLGCGEMTAVKIGTEAKARIKIGRRVLWNIAKVQEYLNTLSEG